MKRLYRSKKERWLAGICGGIGEYFDIDPLIIRVVAIALVFMGGAGILAYIIGIFIIPTAPDGDTAAPDKPVEKEKAADTVTQPPRQESGENSGSTGALIIGAILVVLGGLFLMRNFPFFDNYYWWIRTQLHHFFWPGLLMLVGILLIFKSSKK